MNKNYALLTKQLKIITPLAKEGVVSDMEKIRLEAQMTTLQSTILDKKEQSRNSAREKLNKVQDDYTMLKESIIAAKDRRDRDVILSPTKGIVNQVYVTTIGEVVKPGDTIAEVVPTDESLTVQAFVKPSDIGFLHPGQEALVKVSAYDYSVYGGLHGTLETISPD
ncbi:MAG: HlyD family efflux transporter periplasmic adaptor subunit, partial [Pseudomonadota bacterium]|nr:HlyD family efflux transporter periplasmic adaptor subunit [Pseudomonadota bacterium]